MDLESDKTVRLKVDRVVPARRRPAGIVIGAAAAAVALLLGGGTAWVFWPRTVPSVVADASPPAAAAPSDDKSAAPPFPLPPTVGRAGTTEVAMAPPVATPQPGPSPPDPAPTPPVYAPRLATEAQILQDEPDQLAVYRFEPRPAIVVLQFPTLGQQADALNRVAALIEKLGYPHDAVLSRATLDARIREEGGTPETFYYGHDYRAADIMRFFSLASDLNAQEGTIEDLVHKLGWTPQTQGALISLVRASSAVGLDAKGRAAILRHEISHGFYFTDPVYADYCRQFWLDVLTEPERQKFIAFLKNEGYDTTIEDLVINETQAYLMYTPDRRFFSPEQVSLSPARLSELRQIFAVRMPPGWLRDHTTVQDQP